MDKPLVSVIIPVYNMESYLYECLESVRKQSYKYLEVVLIDDGSVDQSNEICRYFVDLDNRFHLYTHNNRGLPAALNTGLSMAKGSWIMFIDPDDKVEHNIIERLMDSITDNIDIICCCCQVMIKDGMDVEHFFCGSRLFSSFEDKKTLWCQLMDGKYEHPGKRYSGIGVYWGKLYRNRLFKDNSLLFDETLKRMQDNVFNMYAFFYANEVRYIDETLYVYRADHIFRFLSDYADRMVNIYSSLQIARENAFLDLHLFESDYLSNYYYQEAIFNLVLACKYGIFLRKRSFVEQRDMFLHMIKLSCFKNVLLHYKKHVNMFRYLVDHPLRCSYFYFISKKKVFLLHLWGEWRHLVRR